MKIIFSPVRMDAHLALAVSGGSTLTINGEVFDFSSLQDGDRLPAEAVASELIIGDVTREAGEVAVSVILPHGPNAPEAARNPAPVVQASGPVTLPPWDIAPDANGDDQEVYHDPDIAAGTGQIDWLRKETELARQSLSRATWRASATLSPAQFITACVASGVLTMQEARAWLTSKTLPQFVIDAIETLPTQVERDDAELTILGASVVERGSQLIDLLAIALNMTDEQVDAIFGYSEA